MISLPGLTPLAGGSYVLKPSAAPALELGEMSWTRVAGQELGANELSQWLAIAERAATTHYGFADADAVLFVVAGAGTLTIADREFSFTPESGIYVAPGETFAVTEIQSSPVRLLIGVCPETLPIPGIDVPSTTFDETVPRRVVPTEQQPKHVTADRFYQLLVNESFGKCRVTQFIGAIPESKAPEHFHEYEEIIMVLSGRGKFWTGDKHAVIGPGSIIYLPRRQPHCVECTDTSGMRLVGMFYPAGSPAVRY